MSPFSIYKGLHCLPVFFLAMYIGACTTVPQDVTTDQGPVSEPVTQAPIPEPKRVLPERPKIELTEDILFKVLVAEVAGQRGKIDIAVDNYLDLARSTRDPVVIERATRIAVYARDDAAAYEAASLWINVDPLSPDAHQVMTVMTLRRGDIDQALRHLEIILQGSKGKFDQKLWMIANFLGREEDQAAVMLLMERVMENHMDDAEAMYAFSHVAARMGEYGSFTGFTGAST